MVLRAVHNRIQNLLRVTKGYTIFFVCAWVTTDTTSYRRERNPTIIEIVEYMKFLFFSKIDNYDESQIRYYSSKTCSPSTMLYLDVTSISTCSRSLFPPSALNQYGSEHVVQRPRTLKLKYRQLMQFNYLSVLPESVSESLSTEFSMISSISSARGRRSMRSSTASTVS